MLTLADQSELSSSTRLNGVITGVFKLAYILLALFVLSAAADQLGDKTSPPLSHPATSESTLSESTKSAVAKSSTIAPNGTAPNWILSTPDGTSMSLEDIAQQGKATVMIFWSTWCQGCKSLLPALAEMTGKHGNDAAQVVLLNVWEDNDPEAYLQKAKLNFPLLLRSEAVARRYQVGVTPGVVIVDSDRKIRYIRSYQEDAADVLNQIDLWLSGSKTKG